MPGEGPKVPEGTKYCSLSGSNADRAISLSALASCLTTSAEEPSILSQLTEVPREALLSGVAVAAFVGTGLVVNPPTWPSAWAASRRPPRPSVPSEGSEQQLDLSGVLEG